MLRKLICLGLAGALGTLLRYGLSGLVHRGGAMPFPWGTVVVNVAGCALAGGVWSETHLRVGSELRVIVLIGFMGAFTTFSAFALETTQLLRDGEWLLAMENVMLQNVAGIAALSVGLVIGRLL